MTLHFNSVLPTKAEIVLFLKDELESRMYLGAIEHVPLPEIYSGLYNQYVLVPKKDGGFPHLLWPVAVLGFFCNRGH